MLQVGWKSKHQLDQIVFYISALSSDIFQTKKTHHLSEAHFIIWHKIGREVRREKHLMKMQRFSMYHETRERKGIF